MTPTRKICIFLSYLTGIIRIRSAVRIFAPDFISFFAGRQPSGITQFRLTQKSAPVESKISVFIYDGIVRRRIADGLSPFKIRQRSKAEVYTFRNGFVLYPSGYGGKIMTRKIIIACLALCLCLGLCGCGKTEEPAQVEKAMMDAWKKKHSR